MGMLEPMNTWPGSGRRLLKALTTWPSCTGVVTRVAAIAAEARLPELTHRSRHAERSIVGSVSSNGCGSHARTLVATWSWSRHRLSGSTRNVGAAAAASQRLRTRDVGVE